MLGNSLWVFSSSIHVSILQAQCGARFVALFHYFAKCLNLQFVSSHYYLVPVIHHAWKENQAEVIRQVKQTPRNFRFHWLFERYWQGTAIKHNRYLLVQKQILPIQVTQSSKSHIFVVVFFHLSLQRLTWYTVVRISYGLKSIILNFFCL